MVNIKLLIFLTFCFFLGHLFSTKTLSLSRRSKHYGAILKLLRRLHVALIELEWRLRNRDDADASWSLPYRPLDVKEREIRLLIIEPGAWSDPIECCFRHRYLRAIFKPQYETISYVWGDASIRANVCLEGQNVDVPASSERVLRRFRSSTAQRVLWIDALCINQADTDERSSQVALMHEIYSNTTHNLVWLGEDDDNVAAAAVACIRGLRNDMSAEMANTKDPKGLLWSDKGLVRHPSHRPNFFLDEEDADAIAVFYSSAWFQRLWVVQEVALSGKNTGFYGDTRCSLLAILRAARWMKHNIRYMPHQFIKHAGIDNASGLFELCDRRLGTYGSWKGRFGLLNFLSDTFQLHATDKRDYIYAVLGLVRRFAKSYGDSQLLEPDYSKPLEEVFRNAAFYCICDREDLEILFYATHRFGDFTEAMVPGLPSWAPSWSRPWTSENDPSQFMLDAYNASSAKLLKRDIQKSSASRLHLTGILLNEITMRSRIITIEMIREFRQMKVEDMICSSFSYESLDEVGLNDHSHGSLVKTLTVGLNRRNDRSTKQECEAMSAAYHRAIQQEGFRDLKDLSSTPSDDNRLAIELHLNIRRSLKNRRLFTTQSGTLGVGPRNTECGDVIAILHGCKMPVVLRRTQIDAVEHEFVGLCYMDGIMDGEAVEEHRCAGQKDAAFILI